MQLNCKTKSDADAEFELTRLKKGDQFRVAGTDLCLQKIGRSKGIVLKSCQSSNPLQLFRGFQSGRKFDLRPVTSAGPYLTNHHHPKAGEVVFAQTCSKAHRTKTGYWVAYYLKQQHVGEGWIVVPI